MKPFHFHPEAVAETDEAAQFYEERQPDMGKKFIDALNNTLKQIASDPLRYPKIHDSIRKCRVLHFPYGVIFRDQRDTIEIVAVMYFSRNLIGNPAFNQK